MAEGVREQFMGENPIVALQERVREGNARIPTFDPYGGSVSAQEIHEALPDKGDLDRLTGVAVTVLFSEQYQRGNFKRDFGRFISCLTHPGERLNDEREEQLREEHLRLNPFIRLYEGALSADVSLYQAIRSLEENAATLGIIDAAKLQALKAAHIITSEVTSSLNTRMYEKETEISQVMQDTESQLKEQQGKEDEGTAKTLAAQELLLDPGEMKAVIAERGGKRETGIKMSDVFLAFSDPRLPSPINLGGDRSIETLSSRLLHVQDARNFGTSPNQLRCEVPTGGLFLKMYAIPHLVYKSRSTENQSPANTAADTTVGF